MKSKCSFILKASTALVLALLMLFGSVTTVIGAVAGTAKSDSALTLTAKKVVDIAETGAKVDLAETGDDKTFTKNSYFYVKNQAVDGWNANLWIGSSGVDLKLVSGDATYNMSLYDGTAGDSNAVYRAKITTAGTYYGAKFHRYSGSDDWGDPGENWFKTTAGNYMGGSKVAGGSGADYTLSYYAPKVTTATLTIPNAVSGTGTSNDPYILKVGTTYTPSLYMETDDCGATGFLWRTSSTYSSSASTYHTATADSNNSKAYWTADMTAITPSSASSTNTALTYYTWCYQSARGTAHSSASKSSTVYYKVQAAETTYSVAVAAGTGGSVNSTSVNAGATTAVALPTATADYGYKFKNWTASGGGVTITNPTSATGATIKATGTGGTVTANFELDDTLKLGVAGRFHVRTASGSSSWTNTWGTGSGDWSDTGFNGNTAYIPFVWDSTAGKYKVQTYASLAELTSQISSATPYLYVYDKTNSKYLYSSTSKSFTTSVTEVTLTAYSAKSSTYDTYLKFNSTSTDSPVTLWFDATTKKLSYSIPDLYDVTVNNPATGGSVTASPARCEAGTEVTLTITPSSGYQLSSITAKQGSTNVALSGTGNTRTFTMPAGNVTVTPVFSKIDYTLNKNSTSNGSFKLTNASGTEITKAQIGDTVKVVPTANTGYKVNTVKHGTTSTPNTSITASGGTYSFTMGAANEYVAVTFTAITASVKAVAYTSDSASTDGGTVSANLSSVTIASTNKSITATKKDNYSLSGWQISGDNAAHLKYRFGTTGSWTAATKDAVINNTGTTIYIQTDGSSGITTSNAEVRALFVPTDYTGLTVGAQYTEDNSDYTDFATTPSGVTIAANHGTNQTGVAVEAPATDPTGYVFAGWYTANGSFANSANKDTTFKPNAANAKAIARYKKVFSITYSVDNTGTGAGTVTTSKTSVEAGGSYTITATAASHSAVESVKVNGTAKTATASQTISGVSANQTVEVKFKSNVYLKGTMNSPTQWAGDVMTANTAGTSYTIANVVLNANTTYPFRLYADDEWKANSVTTWTLNNIATHGTSGDNLTITPSVKAKVTFVSDGTKFTSITAIPYDSTTHIVTLTQSADYTITSTYMGVEYTTAGKNANVTVPVYASTSFSYTVTPASGKYLSAVAQSNSVALSPAFTATTHANSYTGTVSSVSKAFAVSATAASKLSVAAKTNKSARGTVTVNKSAAAPNESITITVSPKNGTLKSLTATYGNGAVYTCNLSTKAWTRTIAATSAAAPTGMAAPKLSLAEVGANIALVAVGADTTYSMTLAENSSVTINATFDAYSAESTWYYNGYDNSGNALSGYHTKQMTEGMVGGEKFSYYHVEGRTGTDQLMTITDGSSPSYGKVYFTNNYNWNNLHVYFYGSSISWNWPGDGMTYAYDNDSGQAVYSYQIPTGATGVIFNNGQNGVQTQDIDLTNTNGAYYLTGDGASPYATQWDSAPSDAGITKGIEYFYQNSTHNGDYTGDFNTKGFFNHYTASKDFAKPKDLGTKTGDYYINVLYPNTTYTINGVTKTTGSNPMIIWSAEPLAGDDENVTIYAKDGSIRSEAYGSTYANIADTKIYLNNETVGTKHSGNITNQTWETYKAAKGDTIVIKTQIGATDSSTLSNAADLKAKYYVRGFCVNGEVTELLEWNADGLYTLTYKVPEDDEDLKKIEITPIYYLKDTTANPIVTYRVTGFTDELKAVGSGKPNWGDTLYTYPFYGKLGSNNNALGAYPGQPMVYYKGQYQMQIPQKSTAWDIYYDDGALSSYSGNTAKANAVANTNVSGVTMSNGYYDIVHRQIMGYGDNSASADHVQTYDYGDFFKIFNEKAPVDNIVFDFKYETKKHNFENQPAATTTKSVLDTNYGTNGNGFELLTNFHGRTVDLFGTPLSGDAADPSKTTPVYVVSIGGVNGSAGVENIAGYYATEWMVYGSSDGSSYSRISAGGKNSIPPEVLVLNDDDTTSFNTTTYPSADANHNITNWKALYTALEAYRGKPVMISYEAADAQIGAGNYATSGGGGATRNDGRWLYSKNGESITSTIKIQYSDDNGVTYTDLDKTTPQVSGLSAYFTNAEVDEGAMTYSTTIDPDKTFDFEAKTTNGDYKFVGWYMEDGTKITSDNASHTERSGSYTFVAKFMQVQGGQLILSHSADKGTVNSTDYQGAGTATIAVTVKNGSGNDAETIRTYEATTSDITLDDKVISSDKQDYVITVTLNATASGEDTYALTTCNAANTFFGNQSSYISMPQTFSFTVGDLYSSGSTNQSVKSIIYHSYFNQTQFKYQITFKFPSRGSDSNDKNYVREGTLTAAQLANESYYVKNGDTRTLKAAFINRLAPNESNFNQSLGWTITDVNFPSKNGNVYLATAEFTAIKTTEYRKDDQGNVTTTPVRSTLRTATFNLPYAHDATTGAATESGGKVIETTAPNFTISNITFGEIPTVDGAKVVAPRIIYTNSSDETGRYFQYWSIEKSGTEVARCYFNEFNFVAYDNYDITPVYATSAISNLYTIDYTYTGVTYLETSRNQWNTDGTDADKTNRTKAADLLYNDFVLNYNYKNLDIYKNGTDVSAVSDLGYVVERVQQLDMNQDGTLNTNMTLYSNKGLDENGVKDVVTGYTTKGATQNGITKYTGSDSRIARYSIAKTALDNKNRIEIYDAYYNSAGWSNSKQAPAAKYAYKNYVYKVYTYMVINGTTYVSTNPAYFAMYEEATK